MTLPPVLGLPLEQAGQRLAQSGVADVQVSVSGRRREGTPRVIRATQTPQGVLLVVTHVPLLRDIPEPQMNHSFEAGSAPADA